MLTPLPAPSTHDRLLESAAVVRHRAHRNPEFMPDGDRLLFQLPDTKVRHAHRIIIRAAGEKAARAEIVLDPVLRSVRFVACAIQAAGAAVDGAGDEQLVTSDGAGVLEG